MIPVPVEAGALAGGLPPLRGWPDIPACYGWLSLDRRGNWRLKSEIVRHPGLNSYLNSNYSSDSMGNWIVSNGPQTVFVALDYTPLVWRLSAEGLFSSPGQKHGLARDVFADENGNVLISCEEGIGLVDDRDLTQMVHEFRNQSGAVASEAELDRLVGLNWRGHPVQTIMSAEVAAEFGFNPNPHP